MRDKQPAQYDYLVKPKAPHIPWGRKRIRAKKQTSKVKKEIGKYYDAQFERH